MVIHWISRSPSCCRVLHWNRLLVAICNGVLIDERVVQKGEVQECGINMDGCELKMSNFLLPIKYCWWRAWFPPQCLSPFRSRWSLASRISWNSRFSLFFLAERFRYRSGTSMTSPDFGTAAGWRRCTATFRIEGCRAFRDPAINNHNILLLFILYHYFEAQIELLQV